MKIESLIPKYLNHLRVLNRSVHEIKNTKYYLRVFVRYLNDYHANHTIQEITYKTVRDYQEDLSFKISRYGTPWKVHSQNHALSTLRGFFKWLLREDYIISDPTQKIQYAKEPEPLPRHILEESEIKKILKQPDTQTIIGYRDRVILEILYSTGIRKGELENLKLQDVDLKDGFLRINQGKNKKDRVVPLGKIASSMLQNYIVSIRSEIPKGKHKGKETPYLFINQRANKLHHNTVWNIVTHYARRAGIRKKVTPHSFRHTCATHMVRHGAHIRHLQEMLGHKNIETTQIYTRVTINDLKRVHAQFHPREAVR